MDDGIEVGEDEPEGIEPPSMPGIEGIELGEIELGEDDGEDEPEGFVAGSVDALEEPQPATAKASTVAAPTVTVMRRRRVRVRREADIKGSFRARCADRRRG